MRLLYAVQATGNGHITRARALLPALQRAGIEVEFLFSGRVQAQLFDMQPFGDYQHCTGFTFVTHHGRVAHLATLKQLRPWRFIQDLRRLKLQGYDLLLNDFEPVSAWAARRAGLRSIGLAHQYALRQPLPGTEKAFWLKPAIDLFAPVDIPLGVHWQPFGHLTLPPLVAPPRSALQTEPFVLVYLPFEALSQVQSWLEQVPGVSFRIYAPVGQPTQLASNIQLRPLCRQAFPHDLAQCDGVIGNAGFGLLSEALQAGKKLLVKPLQGQIEQGSNARILAQMGRTQVLDTFCPAQLQAWLLQPTPAPVHYGNVAGALAAWLAQGADTPASELVQQVWQGVDGLCFAD